MGSERIKLALVSCRRSEPVFHFLFWFVRFPFRHIKTVWIFLKDTP